MSKYPAPLRLAETVRDLDERIGEHITDSDPAYDNGVRAGFAATALKAFSVRVGDQNEDLETNLGDLLADLMHLCDSLDLSFGAIVEDAEGHYAPEREGRF